MTLLVYEDLALDTFAALSSENPNPVLTEGAERHPVEPLGLEDAAVELVVGPHYSRHRLVRPLRPPLVTRQGILCIAKPLLDHWLRPRLNEPDTLQDLQGRAATSFWVL